MKTTKSATKSKKASPKNELPKLGWMRVHPDDTTTTLTYIRALNMARTKDHRLFVASNYMTPGFAYEVQDNDGKRICVGMQRTKREAQLFAEFGAKLPEDKRKEWEDRKKFRRMFGI